MTLKDWEDRKGEGQSVNDVIGKIYAATSDIPDATVFAMSPPMIAGYGMGNGFELYLQDKAGGNIAAFMASDASAMSAITKTLVYFGLILIGFCIYGPVALVSIQALNLVPKNAAGTAAGFVGLFGYLIGDAILSKLIMGSVAQSAGWSVTFVLLCAASVIAIVLCAMTLKSETK